MISRRLSFSLFLLRFSDFLSSLWSRIHSLLLSLYFNSWFLSIFSQNSRKGVTSHLIWRQRGWQCCLRRKCNFSSHSTSLKNRAKYTLPQSLCDSWPHRDLSNLGYQHDFVGRSKCIFQSRSIQVVATLVCSVWTRLALFVKLLAHLNEHWNWFHSFITCIMLQKMLKRAKYEGWAFSLVQKFVAGSFNFALTQAYACLDDILFYLVLDIKTNPFNSFFSWTSLISAVVFLAVGCLLVFFNFWTVKKYQNIKKQGLANMNQRGLDDFNERNKYWQLFYSDFNDDDLWSQSFFAFLLIRSTLSSLVITVLYDYPLMQTSYLVILDGAIILFLIFKKPFKTIEATLCQYYFEIITLLVHICTFILSMQDTFHAPSEAFKLILSTGIIYLNTALISGSIGFMFVEICKTIRKKIKIDKLKKLQEIPKDNQETQNLALTTDPLQSPETYLQRRQNRINHEDVISIEDSDLFTGMNQNMSVLNMESPQIRESSFNADNSLLSGMNQRKRINRMKGRSTRPILFQQLPRTLKQRQPKKKSRNANNVRNNRQFENT